MTDDEAGEVAEEYEERIVNIYEMGLGRVKEPVVVVICEKDGSLRVTGHDRTTLLKNIPSRSKLHEKASPCDRGYFWCFVVDAKSGSTHTYKMRHFALTAPGTSGLH